MVLESMNFTVVLGIRALLIGMPGLQPFSTLTGNTVQISNKNLTLFMSDIIQSMKRIGENEIE